MGLIDRFGRIADTYISEKEQLLEAEEERRRVFTGHSFWPTEVLRDTIIFASIIMVIAFYSWIIPPPLHNAADPYAQAGFVFPDWYVLFLIWISEVGRISAAIRYSGRANRRVFRSTYCFLECWRLGAMITGLPVGILALPPFILGKREKRGLRILGSQQPVRFIWHMYGSSQFFQSIYS